MKNLVFRLVVAMLLLVVCSVLSVELKNKKFYNQFEVEYITEESTREIVQYSEIRLIEMKKTFSSDSQKFHETTTQMSTNVVNSYNVYSSNYFREAGRISWGDWSWTYYSERILPGYRLKIPGRNTDLFGYVRDGDGYLCLASDVLKKGTIIDTPFGSQGKVYDCGCGNNYTVDVYVNW